MIVLRHRDVSSMDTTSGKSKKAMAKVNPKYATASI